jgi:hypothetical protein
MFSQLKHAILRWCSHGARFTARRSSHWPKVRADFLKEHPVCFACGGKEKLEVHHVRPFHLCPGCELDPKNLATLCNRHGCHFGFGHLYDWAAYNPHLIVDALRQRARVANRRYEVGCEQPEPVCSCGSTSDGTCPRCGQTPNP